MGQLHPAQLGRPPGSVAVACQKQQDWQNRLSAPRFITLFDEAGKTRATLAATQENKDSSLLWTFFSSKDFKFIDKQRQGFLLYNKQAGR